MFWSLYYPRPIIPPTAFLLFYLTDDICRDDIVSLADVKPDPKKANPKVGPSQIAFSPDNRYIYSRNGNNNYGVIQTI